MRALITGGTGKLGAAVAERLRNEGWQVVAAGSRDGDLSAPTRREALVERAVAELGGLDVVVNGASAGFEPKRFEDVTEEDVDAALGATVKGSFFVTQAAAPHLRESARARGHGRGRRAATSRGPRSRRTARRRPAQAMLTRVLARALAPEVRVCGVAPGTVAVRAGTGGAASSRDACSTASARRTTSPTRSSISPAPLRHRDDDRRRRRPSAANRADQQCVVRVDGAAMSIDRPLLALRERSRKHPGECRAKSRRTGN